MSESLAIALFIISLLLLWAALFHHGRYFLVILLGITVRLICIVLQEHYRFFGDNDQIDYLPYLRHFDRILALRQHGKLFEPHVPAYCTMYSGWIFRDLGLQGLWLIRLANAAIGLLTLIPLCWIARLLFRRDLTPFQAGVLLLWPTWLRYNVEIGRSAPTVFFTLLGVAGLMAFAQEAKLRHALSAVVTIVLAFYLRVHYFLYFLSIIVLSEWTFLQRIHFPDIRTVIRWTRVVVLLAVPVLFLLTYQQFAGPLFSMGSWEDLLQIAARREEGNSTYLTGVYPRNLFDLAWYLPIHGFYFLFSPMPWDIRTPFAAGSCLQAWMILLALVVLLLKYRLPLIQHQGARTLLLTIFLVAALMGAVTKNAGGAERWRLPSTLILLVIVTSFSAFQPSKDTRVLDGAVMRESLSVSSG